MIEIGIYFSFLYLNLLSFQVVRFNLIYCLLEMNEIIDDIYRNLRKQVYHIYYNKDLGTQFTLTVLKLFYYLSVFELQTM